MALIYGNALPNRPATGKQDSTYGSPPCALDVAEQYMLKLLQDHPKGSNQDQTVPHRNEEPSLDSTGTHGTTVSSYKTDATGIIKSAMNDMAELTIYEGASFIAPELDLKVAPATGSAAQVGHVLNNIVKTWFPLAVESDTAIKLAPFLRVSGRMSETRWKPIPKSAAPCAIPIKGDFVFTLVHTFTLQHKDCTYFRTIQMLIDQIQPIRTLHEDLSCEIISRVRLAVNAECQITSILWDTDDTLHPRQNGNTASALLRTIVLNLARSTSDLLFMMKWFSAAFGLASSTESSWISALLLLTSLELVFETKAHLLGDNTANGTARSASCPPPGLRTEEIHSIRTTPCTPLTLELMETMALENLETRRTIMPRQVSKEVKVATKAGPQSTLPLKLDAHSFSASVGGRVGSRVPVTVSGTPGISFTSPNGTTTPSKAPRDAGGTLSAGTSSSSDDDHNHQRAYFSSPSNAFDPDQLADKLQRLVSPPRKPSLLRHNNSVLAQSYPAGSASPVDAGPASSCYNRIFGSAGMSTLVYASSSDGSGSTSPASSTIYNDQKRSQFGVIGSGRRA